MITTALDVLNTFFYKKNKKKKKRKGWKGEMVKMEWGRVSEKGKRIKKRVKKIER